MDFTNKNVVIIGGNSGIGLALAKSIVDAGGTVFTVSRTAADPGLADRVSHISLDVTSDDLSTLADFLPDHIHGLAYCPGTILLKPFTRLTDTDFQTDYQINVLGAVRVIRECIGKLKKTQSSSIVLFSSVAATTGMNFHASVASAKAAVEGLALSLAAEFAASGIRVNVVAPSLTETPLAERLLGSEKLRDGAAGRHPLKRFGQPDDIAAAATFLLSDGSSWITGQKIAIDGGIGNLRP